MSREDEQRKLGRVGADSRCVHLLYDLEHESSVAKHELPFVVGVLAGLSGKSDETSPPLEHRKFIEINRDNFDQVLSRLNPRLAIRVENQLAKDGSKLNVLLAFASRDDFLPERVALQVEPLRQLIEVRGRLTRLAEEVMGQDGKLEAVLQEVLSNPETRARVAGEAGRLEPAQEGLSKPPTVSPTPSVSGPERGEESLLDSIIAQLPSNRGEEQRRQARDLISELVDQVMSGQLTLATNAIKAVEQRVAQIDAVISNQLDAILHHPDFQAIEAAWRGLSYLVHQTETSATLRIKVLDASKSELQHDFATAASFKDSGLYRRIDNDIFNTFGSDPFVILIGDYSFGPDPRDVGLLAAISHVAAAAHAPFVAAASPAFFQADDFSEIDEPRDLSVLFRSPLYNDWQAFRDSEDARYVGLCLPRILLRLPYGPLTRQSDSFNYVEQVPATDLSRHLLGNAAFAFAVRLTDSFARYQACTWIQGGDGGGLVEGLPCYTYKTDEGDVELMGPTEVALSHRNLDELPNLGFIPLAYRRGTDTAVFFVAPSCMRPRE